MRWKLMAENRHCGNEDVVLLGGVTRWDGMCWDATGKFNPPQGTER